MLVREEIAYKLRAVCSENVPVRGFSGLSDSKPGDWPT